MSNLSKNCKNVKNHLLNESNYFYGRIQFFASIRGRWGILQSINFLRVPALIRVVDVVGVDVVVISVNVVVAEVVISAIILVVGVIVDAASTLIAVAVTNDVVVVISSHLWVKVDVVENRSG